MKIFKDKIFRLLLLMALAITIMSCEDDCNETVYVTNSDGTTSIECVIYNN